MYTIKLTQYAFDNTYTNARLFENKTERDAYFENLQGYTFNKDVNFIARDIIATDIDIKVEPETPLFVLLNYNYCVVKNDEETLYFYIRKSEQLSANLIRCRLENDIIQNYLYDTEFSDCMITKAHLNRFIDNGDGTVSFDGNATSKLFEREEIKDLSKRLVYREKLIFKIDTTDNSLFNKWLSDNVAGWMYVCCSKLNDGYNFYGQSGEQKINLQYTRLSDLNNFSRLPSYTHCTLCFPIYKKSAAMIAQSNDGTFSSTISSSALDEFINNNNGYSNIYSIKISPKPPFLISNYSNKYTISQGPYYNYLMLKLDSNEIRPDKVGYSFNGLKAFNTDFDTNTNSAASLFYIEDQDVNGVELYLDNNSILPKLTFNKNDIINSNRNYLFNPKLNNADYKELRITMVGSSESYDIQKLNDAYPKFIYKEMIGADITKGNIKYKSNNSENIFNIFYNESYNGLSFTNDLSIPIASNIFDQYLANNKNAFLSFQNTQTLSNIKFGVQSVKGLAGAIASMSPANIAQFGIGFGAAVVEHTAQLQYEQAQFNLTIDNMKSAPETLQNNNGSTAQALAISDLGVYIEIYEALPNELEIANNITYDKGFVYNQYDNIKNHINTRKYFNYIQANIENIKADLSNDIKLRMRQIFANGIKFWHTDDIIFNKENYERSLEANG